MTLVQTELKKIYIRVEAQPVTTAGIYHSPDLGLISLSSDGTNWITIADKNLGATQVYNNGDTLSEANCGKYYQRGNNYGFPFSGTISADNNSVNATGYGPGNYYYGTTFHYPSGGDWDSSYNTNLWGDTTDTLEARKGPCNTGFHVPTSSEFSNVATIAGWVKMEERLKMPKAGWLYSRYASKDYLNSRGFYWTSTADSVTASTYVWINTGSYQDHRGYGCSIRPFANTPVQPDEARTKLN